MCGRRVCEESVSVGGESVWEASVSGSGRRECVCEECVCEERMCVRRECV